MCWNLLLREFVYVGVYWCVNSFVLEFFVCAGAFVGVY